MESWKQIGYRIEIVYLRLDSVDLALRRIAARVLQGGHDVARRDVIRRCAPTRRQVGAQDRPDVLHADLHLGGWKGRSEKAVAALL